MFFLKRIVILLFYLELLDDDKTSTILTSTLQSSTNRWQPGQIKNCTEPGKFYINTKFSFFSIFSFEAIDEFPEDLFTQTQRQHVRK